MTKNEIIVLFTGFSLDSGRAAVLRVSGQNENMAETDSAGP